MLTLLIACLAGAAAEEPAGAVQALGVGIPPFAGESAWLESPPSLTAGVGFVRGNVLGQTQLSVGFSPAALAVWESGGGPVRAFVGVQSAPLFIWLAGGEGSGITLAMVDVGWTYGTDRLRIGPTTSVGLLAAGMGVRAVWTPWQPRDGMLRGVEARATWYMPRAGHAGLYLVGNFGARGEGPAVPQVDPGELCQRFAVSAGAAAAVSNTELAWELVGQEGGPEWTGSPAVALSCDTGSRRAGWSLGGESAPRVSYRAPTADGGGDRQLRHFGSLTAGAWLGGETLRMGPIVTAGIWALGGGLRASFTPIEADSGARHGLELRAMAMLPSTPAAEFMLLYQVAFDPRGAP